MALGYGGIDFYFAGRHISASYDYGEISTTECPVCGGKATRLGSIVITGMSQGKNSHAKHFSVRENRKLWQPAAEKAVVMAEIRCPRCRQEQVYEARQIKFRALLKAQL